MSPKKLLLTGVTGYIGGDVFHTLYEAHPELQYTLIVRNEERAKPVREKYPDDKIRIVYGNYLEILEDEASKTDIIVHTAESADDVPSAEAISRGVQKATNRSVDQPIYWIHLCGTGILQWYDLLHQRHGQPPLPHETYSDIASLPRLLTLPDSAPHRDVDKVVLATNHLAPSSVRTAIISPPTIYGPGRGPVNTTSQQLPSLARFVLTRRFAPSVGPTGLTEWDNIHITDVSALFARLVSAALNPIEGHDEAVFGLGGYYFCESGRAHVWSRVALAIADEAVRQGYLAEAVSKTVGIDEVPDKSWGTNSKSVAERAGRYLDWRPTGPAWEDELPGLVEGEAKKLGLKKVGEV